MRFDLIANFSPGETKPWPRVLEMIKEQCSLAEQAGFTTAWFTEHHFAHNGYMNAPPNPIQMATHIAAHCQKLRVGTAPIVLPDWHPIRVAEDVAMLDNMTLGRVDFGVAKGINDRSTIQFNRDADRRDNNKVMRLYQENLEIILKAWTNEVFTHKGEFWEFPVPGWQEKNRFFEPLDPKYHDESGEYKAMYIHPRPYTEKHPPVWLMSNAPPTFKLAGEKGWGVISMSAGPKATLACWETYRAALSKSSNREVELGEGVGVCTAFYVGETMQEAIDTIRPAINAYYEFLGGSRPAGEWTKRGYLDVGEEMTPEDDAMDWFDFLNKRGIIVVGDAEYVSDRFSEKQETIGLDHLMLMQQYTGVPYEKILASWNRLFEKVVPRFGTQSLAQKREAINA
ncbi:MAG: LLM class flavin-dependent oxidoreductase [Amylibacter sp.]